tara:strand:+ start:1607 stop:1744 length:138 start_codon:yes stop_codon:yes gene_type:complete
MYKIFSNTLLKVKTLISSVTRLLNIGKHHEKYIVFLEEKKEQKKM